MTRDVKRRDQAVSDAAATVRSSIVDGIAIVGGEGSSRPKQQRPKCVICNGAGTTSYTAFSDPNQTVTQSCNYCHGKKVMGFEVDVYDVLDWLLELGYDDLAKAAESRWGYKPPQRGDGDE